MEKACPECFEKLHELERACGACGYRVELISEEEDRERYLSGLSPGALFWTQVYAFGSRQYFWFIMSMIPLTWFVALPALVLRGRRWSWKHGGWKSFEEFKKRQVFLDRISIAWVSLIIITIVVWGAFVK